MTNGQTVTSVVLAFRGSDGPRYSRSGGGQLSFRSQGHGTHWEDAILEEF
ncbi:polyprenyl synthetase [Aspergillus luchuensis]|uniref:Polyprenyl synthetase n=1 Tax=Aspergillus kawachii TaxID=1069201 RepID=A0A146FP00_ASPKA|nr:polyprenyl synthetase [Aspergillus luchuensis]